jgi:hypothetical protein
MALTTSALGPASRERASYLDAHLLAAGHCGRRVPKEWPGSASGPRPRRDERVST